MYSLACYFFSKVPSVSYSYFFFSKSLHTRIFRLHNSIKFILFFSLSRALFLCVRVPVFDRACVRVVEIPATSFRNFCAAHSSRRSKHYLISVMCLSHGGPRVFCSQGMTPTPVSKTKLFKVTAERLFKSVMES